MTLENKLITESLPSPSVIEEILKKVTSLSLELIQHKGFGDMKLETRLLKRGQKEVIIHCGKQYRFVVGEANRQVYHQ